MFIIIFLLIGTSIIQVFLTCRQWRFLTKYYKNAELKQQIVYQYNIDKLKMALIDWFAGVGLICFWLFSGSVKLLEKILMAVHSESLVRIILLIGIIFLSQQFLDLFLNGFRTFILEKKYQFTQISYGDFAIFSIKKLLVRMIYFLMIISTIFYLYQSTAWWWLWAWILFLFSLFMTYYLYPFIIEPFFYQFKKLHNTQLESQLNKLLAHHGFTYEGVYIKNEARFSSHTNAYVSGFGKSKRIILFDTLFKSLSVDEIAGVVAHELGHIVHHDVVKYILLNAIMGLSILIFIAYLLSQNLWQHSLSMITTPTGVFAVLYILMPFLVFIISPLTNYLLRHFEFNADYFAAKLGYAVELSRSLDILAETNAAPVNADRYYVLWFYSHPVIIERIKILKGYCR